MRDSTFKFNLGDKVKDRITGFAGIIVARTEWFNGCLRYQVQTDKVSKDNKLPEPEPFDEQQLDMVQAEKVTPTRYDEPVRSRSVLPAVRTGGPRRDDKSPVRRVRD